MCDDIAIPLNADQGYKYLGITENRRSEIAEETFEKIRAEIMKRVRSLSKTRLNGRNIIKAINEYALSVINYYIGVIPLQHAHYERLDDEIRKILVEH